jgi:hypothetical protein
MSTNGESFVQSAIEHPEVSVPVAIASAAAIAAAVWAFKGNGLSLMEHLSPLAKADEVSPFMSLGGEVAAGDLARLEKGTAGVQGALHPADLSLEEVLDAHAAGFIYHEPEDAGFARALAMALEHDGRLGRMAARSVGGYIPPEEEARFSNLSRLAAERGIKTGSV